MFERPPGHIAAPHARRAKPPADAGCGRDDDGRIVAQARAARPAQAPRATEQDVSSAIQNADILGWAQEMFPGGDLKSRAQRLRPYICPFELIVERVPQGARLLDVGCGPGLLLGLLAMSGKLESGIGFDSDAAAIDLARKTAGSARGGERLRFERIGVEDAWPEGDIDAVAMVDVMHHVPPSARGRILELIAERLPSGGTFIYKDMVRTPLWQAWGNRLHDLVLAQDWISYEPMDRVVAACAELGLRQTSYDRFSRYWYGHEMAVFRKD